MAGVGRKTKKGQDFQRRGVPRIGWRATHRFRLAMVFCRTLDKVLFGMRQRTPNLTPAVTPPEHRALALAAASDAERVLWRFEEACPGDTRPRQAIEAARAWARGEIKVSEARRAAFAAHAAARAAASPIACAAARAAGHAAATAHVPSHAPHASAYARTASGTPRSRPASRRYFVLHSNVPRRVALPATERHR